MAHKRRVPAHPLILALDRVMAKKGGGTNAEVAKAIGMTEGGVRWCRKWGWPPKNPMVQKALADWIEGAKTGEGR